MTTPAALRLVEVTPDKPTHVEPVTVYPSRISLSSWRGCNLRCGYCVLQADPVVGDPFRARRVSPVADLLAAYDDALALNPGAARLKLTINDHTDPFLTPEIAEDTLAILEGLASRQVTVPVMITTKLHPGPERIQRLATLARRLRLTVFVSVADFGGRGRVEQVEVGPRFQALRDLADAGLHAVLYLKPIGPWTDIAALSDWLRRYARVVGEVVLSPLKDDPDAALAYASDAEALAYGFGGAQEGAIVAAIHAVNPVIKVSRKRSCAVNRRYRLGCMPPLFGKAPAVSDLYVNAVSAGGYCELRAPSALGERPDLVLALSLVAELLQKLDVRWALMGSMRCYDLVTGTVGPAVGDIDVALLPRDLPRVHEAFRAYGQAPAVFMGCTGFCSGDGRSRPALPAVADLERFRSTVRVRVAGVQVDFSTKDEAVIAAATLREVAGVVVPLAPPMP